MNIRCYRIFTCEDYDEWYGAQAKKSQYQIESRLSKIESNAYFGDHKSVTDDDTIWELKWKSGRRIYYAYIPDQNILLLLGGNKNGQDKDIKKAENIYAKKTRSQNRKL